MTDDDITLLGAVDAYIARDQAKRGRFLQRVGAALIALGVLVGLAAITFGVMSNWIVNPHTAKAVANTCGAVGGFGAIGLIFIGAMTAATGSDAVDRSRDKLRDRVAEMVRRQTGPDGIRFD